MKNKSALTWLIVLVLINLIDYGLTRLVGEWSEELNPFLNALQEPGRSVFKLVWPTVSGIFFYAACQIRLPVLRRGDEGCSLELYV